jgi:hypothetical protein
MRKRLPVTHCPACGSARNGADRESKPGDRTEPRPGDFSVCVGCSCVTIFADDLTLRGLKPDEMALLLTDDTLRNDVLRVVAEVRLSFGGRAN